MPGLENIPSVDSILTHPLTEQLLGTYGREWIVSATRKVQNAFRGSYKELQTIPAIDEWIQMIATQLEMESTPTLKPVINATGVILHTNLGRAPLSSEAIRAIQSTASGYSTLEYDLEAGKRGKRDVHAEQQLTEICGSEAAVVVNNNASAVLLCLTALARRKKVVISRSQLVEIGGGFRIPDVLRESGAKLLEVGTTNRTHLIDFESTIQEGAALVLVAHHSNFRISGFSTEPNLKDLANLAHRFSIPLLYDLGSGALVDTAKYGLAHEPTVQEALDAGCDLVCFSGDKLLGGPQAGIIVGNKLLLAKIRKHPLYRAIRPDKLCLAALTATLGHYQKGDFEKQIPLYRMLSLSAEILLERVKIWQNKLELGRVVTGYSTTGGGSLPEENLPTWLLELDLPSPNRFLAHLRDQDPPVIARIQADKVVFDPRTVLHEQQEAFINSVRKSLILHKEK